MLFQGFDYTHEDAYTIQVYTQANPFQFIEHVVLYASINV